MPYEIIKEGDRVKVSATGKVGVVISLGAPQNPRAHFMVRHDEGAVIWYSRDEVCKLEGEEVKQKGPGMMLRRTSFDFMILRLAPLYLSLLGTALLVFNECNEWYLNWLLGFLGGIGIVITSRFVRKG